MSLRENEWRGSGKNQHRKLEFFYKEKWGEGEKGVLPGLQNGKGRDKNNE